jgi:hypothetical protein
MGGHLLAVDDVLVVEVLQHQQHLRSVEAGSTSGKAYSNSVRRLRLERRPKSSPPGQYSRTRKSFFSVWKEACILMRKG